MKRSITFFVFILFCSACFGQNKIELNLTKGQVYMQKMAVVMAVKQKIINKDILINMAVNGTMAYTVTDIKVGVYDIDVAYKHLAVKTELPDGKSLSFDSDKADKKDTMSLSLGLMKDKSFHMKMNKRGQILEVSNMSNLYSSMFSNFPGMTPLQKQKLQAQIEQSFGEKAFKNNLQNMVAFYPQGPISQGSKWTVKNTTSSANMNIQMDNNFTLDEVTEGQYLISGVSKMSSPNAGAFTEINGMSAKTDINGNVTTKMKVNKKTGWVDESVTNMNLKSTVTFKANEKMPQGMTIPMEISSSTTLIGN